MKYQSKYQKYLKDQITRAESKWGRKHDYDEIFKQQLRLTIKEVEEFIGYPQKICCMGCRTGTEVFEFKEKFPRSEVHGIDITENINSIRTHLDVSIELQDFNNLPVDWTDRFDLVFSNSIDHAFDPAKTFKEWKRVTKPDGHLLIEFSTTPPNNIEHSFTISDVESLNPIVMWESPERNLITGLFKK